MPDEQIGQDEIEELLRQAQAGDAAQPPPPPEPPQVETGPAEDPVALDQSEIEALLQSAQGGTASGQASPAAVETVEAPPSEKPASGDDIDFLLQQAQQALASVDSPTDTSEVGAAPFQFRDFAGAPPSTERATLDLIRDVELNVKIELGRAQMYLEDVLRLRKGSVVPLDKLAGDPVDIYVNGRLIARGEVLVLNDNFCVRVAELLATETLRTA